MQEEPLKNVFPTSCCRKSKLWRNKKTMNHRKKCIDFGANLFCQNRSIHPHEPIRIHFFSDNNILKDCCRFGQCTRFSKPKFGIIGKCIIGVQAFFFKIVSKHYLESIWCRCYEMNAESNRGSRLFQAWVLIT